MLADLPDILFTAGVAAVLVIILMVTLYAIFCIIRSAAEKERQQDRDALTERMAPYSRNEKGE